jgi:DNA-binding HxlR family transcriptional regulator
MPEFDFDGQRYQNPVELAMHVIGGKWKMPILWRIKDRPRRYGEIKKTLPKTSHKMLAQQLQELEKHGFIRRKVYPTVPPSVEYSMTPKGKGVIPVIETIRDWGNALRESGTSEKTGANNGRRQSQGRTS